MIRWIGTVLLAAWAGSSAAQIADPDALARALFLEAVRSNPQLAQDPSTQTFAYRNYVAPGTDLRAMTAQDQQGALADAGDWIAARIADPSALPIEAEIVFPGSVRRTDAGAFLLAGNLGKKIGPVSGTLDEITIRAPLQTPPVVLRPVQPFDLGAMRPHGAAEDRLAALADTRQGLMVVARVTINEVEAQAAGMPAIGGGRVTEVALHELIAVDRELAAGDLIWQVSDAGSTPAEITAADIDRAFRLDRAGDTYLDTREGAQQALTRVLAWTELTSMPITTVLERRLSQDAFWFAFSEIAPRDLQDALIPPHKLGPSRRGFAPGVDVIEQMALEDAALRRLWPEVAEALPDIPLTVVSRTTIQMQDYDPVRQGFVPYFRGSGWLLGGQYPVLANLPEFLSMPPDQAQVLLRRLDQIDGPGRRLLTLQARMDVSVRASTSAEDGPLAEPRIVPDFTLVSASLHAGARHADAESLAVNKVMDLDPTAYRGPAQPVADHADLEFWSKMAEDRGARGEHLIAAAIAVAEDPAALARAMDRQGATNALAAAQALEMPDPLILTGQLTFTEQNGTWTASGFRYTFWTNESGFEPPTIQIADTAILTALTLTPEQADAMAAIGGRAQYRAEITPVTVALEGARPALFVRFDEIALFSIQKDETGLPLLRAVLEPDPPSAAPPEAEAPELGDAPAAVVLDHDLLDLLHVREASATVDEATLDRMFLDRLHRELRSPDSDLVWGRFFDPAPERLNRVERAARLPAFRAWQEARAAAMPDTVIVRVATNPIQAGCGVMTYADPSQVQHFSDGVGAILEERGYVARRNANAATLTMLERAAREVPNRMPLLAEERLSQIGGRPVYQLLRASRHPTAGPCIGNERLDAVTDGFDPAMTGFVDAVVILDNPVLLPNERRGTVETRHIARLSDIAFRPGGSDGIGPRHAGTLVLSLDVSDSVFYTADALPSRHSQTPGAAPVRIAVSQVRELSVPRPAATDIKGLDLALPASEIGKAFAAMETREERFDRQIAPRPVSGQGDRLATEAGTAATFGIDAEAGEVLATFEDERLPASRIGIGRVQLYDPAQVTPDGVQGALLKKYGNPTLALDDRRGGQPLRRLVWGYDPAISHMHCLPIFDLTATRVAQEAFAIRSQEDRAVHDLASRLPWPNFGGLTESGPDFSVCDLLVIAEVSATPTGVALVTWILDPGSLADLDWARPPPSSTRELIENSADIDL